MFVCLIAGYGNGIVHAKGIAFADDLGLGQVDQWCVDRRLLAFDPRLGGKIGQALKGSNELWPAVWIA